ncbi:MAG: signal peptidase I [Nocardioidaceae bacterium]
MTLNVTLRPVPELVFGTTFPLEAAPAGQSRSPRVLRALVVLVAWVVILGCAALVTAMVAIPRLAGATPYTVLTGSMTGTYDPGTLVVTKPVPVGSLVIGDPITYQLESGEPQVVTHRIVGISVNQDGEPRFTTKGDANPVADAQQVRPEQVRGKVWYALPYVGRLNTLLNGSRHGLFVAAAIVGLFGYAAAMFAGAARDARRARKEGKWKEVTR